MSLQTDLAAPPSSPQGPANEESNGWEAVVLPYLVRFVCGGVVVAAIPWIAHRFSPAVAGVMVLLPAVTWLGFFFVGRTEGMSAVHEASRGALLALPAMACFLLAVYALSRWWELGLFRTMAYALAIWWLVAVPIILAQPLLSRRSLLSLLTLSRW